MSDMATYSVGFDAASSADSMFDYLFDPATLDFENIPGLPNWSSNPHDPTTDFSGGRMDLIKAESFQKCSSSTSDSSEPSSPEPSSPLNGLLHFSELQHTEGFSNYLSSTEEDLTSNMGTDMCFSPNDDDSGDHFSTFDSEKKSKKSKRKDSSGALKGLINTTELENFTKNIQSKRPLSADEEVALKKQRRLIKNRESAQKSRLRKKRYVEELEKQVQELSDMNTRLEIENKSLMDDVGYLATVVRKAPGIPNEVLKGVARKSTHSTDSAKAAGVCLLIVLFSFGLFFNSKTGAGLALPFEVDPRDSTPNREAEGTDRRYGGDIIGINDPQQQFMKSKNKRLYEEMAEAENSFDEDEEKKNKRLLKKIKLEPKDDEMDSGHVRGGFEETQKEPNQSSSFMFYSDVRDIFGNDEDVASPRSLSLVLPPSGEVNTVYRAAQPQDPLVEVAYQIVNMNVFT
eukprot:TRINITY_DN2374_c0_g1_i1.p1 TRINITY_DN2374_c0_g1~~TRINITY_DN2374_c0_g1_i1.p1  ORF type:complete len:458 (+),score=102.32 TRINITY_DN2374_c0_g1_i1:109-1482(+)